MRLLGANIDDKILQQQVALLVAAGKMKTEAEGDRLKVYLHWDDNLIIQANLGGENIQKFKKGFLGER